MTTQDFVIKQNEYGIYGDDLRAIIRAVTDKLGRMETDKENLEWLLNEGEYILQYEL